MKWLDNDSRGLLSGLSLDACHLLEAAPCGGRVTENMIDAACTADGIDLSEIQRDTLLAFGGLTYPSAASFQEDTFDVSILGAWSSNRSQRAYQKGDGRWLIGRCFTDEAFDLEGLWIDTDGKLTDGGTNAARVVIYDSIQTVVERDATIRKRESSCRQNYPIKSDAKIEVVISALDGEVMRPASDSVNKVIVGDGFVALWQEWWPSILEPRSQNWGTFLGVFAESHAVLSSLAVSLQQSGIVE